MVNKFRIPVSTILSLWLLPISIVCFLIAAFFVPAYESRLGYFVSMFTLMFMIINAFNSIIASLTLCRIYNELENSKSAKAFNFFKAIIFHVFGGYHFFRKIKQTAEKNDIEIESKKGIDSITVFYIFFVVIAVIVTYMMSSGIGN